MSPIIIDNQINDLNTIIFALGSVPADESLVSELISDLEQVKSCMKELKTVSLVYQNFFERNNTSKDMQNHLKLTMTEKCLSGIKEKASKILQLIEPLNYPLPEIFLTKIDVKSSEVTIDPTLEFELKLFNWLLALENNPMEPQLLTELQTREGFNELNLQVPENYLGFLTYGTIVDDWKYKDLRLNKTLDSLLKEWEYNDILKELHITCKNEFLTLKNGLLIVSKA